MKFERFGALWVSDYHHGPLVLSVGALAEGLASALIEGREHPPGMVVGWGSAPDPGIFRSWAPVQGRESRGPRAAEATRGPLHRRPDYPSPVASPQSRLRLARLRRGQGPLPVSRFPRPRAGKRETGSRSRQASTSE